MFLRRAFFGGAAVSSTAFITHFLFKRDYSEEIYAEPLSTDYTAISNLPSRSQLLSQLKNDSFDLLIIGGGATGAGCAMDAATRGLKVAMVERDDFSAGTSSKSTKLVHGGVRYLEKAFLNLDMDQYELVKEALHERGAFLKIAPYLAYQLPIMLPIYQWWKVPYFWVGAKVYDLIAGRQALSGSYFMSAEKALENFPMLKSEKLVGALVYYDGAQNDSRMNVALALSSIAHGATVLNHMEVLDLIKAPKVGNKEKEGDVEIIGATVKDILTGEIVNVKAKGVINATGPFTDAIRKMDDPSIDVIVSPSAGTHITLPNYYSPKHMGLIDPSTSDGRVIFFLPWEGSVIAGTTDAPTDVTANPIPTEKEISWILQEIQNYLNNDIKVRRGDVLSAWSGIRPLVRDPDAKDTSALVRNHMINISPSGLLTIAGGKWTTYRAMAEETIDKAIQVFGLSPSGPCVTSQTPLIGSHNWSKNMFLRLIQHFGLDTQVAEHLCKNYGDRAWIVASYATYTNQPWPIYGKKLDEHYPFIEGEVRYACHHEYACTAVDVLARRTRLAFLNARAALDAAPRVIDIMAEELGWDRQKQKEELQNVREYLKTMGLFPSAPGELLYSQHCFRPEELNRFKAEFVAMDKDHDGTITKADAEKLLGKLGFTCTADEWKQVYHESRLKAFQTFEYNRFLELVASVKEMKDRARFSMIVQEIRDAESPSTDRSGGGI